MDPYSYFVHFQQIHYVGETQKVFFSGSQKNVTSLRFTPSSFYPTWVSKTHFVSMTHIASCLKIAAFPTLQNMEWYPCLYLSLSVCIGIFWEVFNTQSAGHCPQSFRSPRFGLEEAFAFLITPRWHQFCWLGEPTLRMTTLHIFLLS